MGMKMLGKTGWELSLVIGMEENGNEKVVSTPCVLPFTIILYHRVS